ncbi:MAG: DEAD/DEAH box helicase [Candidatus Pacearchaeota archaeon]
MKTFEELGLGKELLEIVGDAGFDSPTEIQEKAIPLALEGKDVIGGSATGSGKTLAFAVPIIKKVKPNEGIQSLVLTPTRELAQQVSQAIRDFSKNKHLNIATVYGGVSIEDQIRDLRRSEVVVGTPGRILDHLSRKTIDLSNVKVLVLDEADRMFDMGFIHDVTDIIQFCPKERQTLLFSATISSDIAKISKRYMKDPEQISAEPEVDPSKLSQAFYDVPQSQKFSLLVHLLQEEGSNLVMVFCNTKRNADLVTANLETQGFDVMALHGNLSQSKREKVLKHFHKSQKFILVCTDVAARGLDIKGVSHVYNYDFPNTREDYTHRIGRTARAGKDGKAITILTSRDYQNFRKATRYMQQSIEQMSLPKFERVYFKASENANKPRGQQRSRRPGRPDGQGPRPGRRFPSRGARTTHGSRDSRGGRSGRDNRGGSRGFRSRDGGSSDSGNQRRFHKSRSSNPQGRKIRNARRQGSGRR